MALASRPNDFLVQLEKRLIGEYANLSKIEEEFWAMKSRVNLLVQGNRNTAFFHTFVLVRRRRNRVVSMKDDMGNWLSGDAEISSFIREGFVKLFTTDASTSYRAYWNPPFWKCALKDAEKGSLDRPITDDEISAALWSLKPYKAPGPDGLHASFFQRFWLLVGDSVRKVIKEAFTSCKIPNYLNQTLVTLIPTCEALSGSATTGL